jgi:aspartate kinase
MALIVQKYGGSSVSTPERIRGVAARIAETRRQGASLVVVVSAMGDTTDDLIELAHKVSKAPPHREMDMLLTAGERISMALLCMALHDLGVPAVSFTGSQSGIITNESHRRARIRRILGDRLRASISSDKVAIVAGFQGVSESREITTLGRGGSDTTAVALAAVLNAEKCEIYTDVDGVYSADPRLVPNAKLWPRLPHDLMVEMANRGAGVLHPRSVELAKKFQVRLWVRNSQGGFEAEGTEIVTEPGREGAGKMEEFKITGVSADKSKCLIEVEMERASASGALWDRAKDANLHILAPFFWGSEIRFFGDRECEGEWAKHLTQLCSLGFVRRFTVSADITPLSVVGDRFSQDGSALSEVVETLAQSQISVTMGSAGTLAITVGVPLSRADEGVRALHGKFLGSGQSGAI